MVRLPLQGFIQVPWIQTYPRFLLNCVIWVNGDCQCPFLQLHNSLPSQYVPLPPLVSLVLLETRSPP